MIFIMANDSFRTGPVIISWPSNNNNTTAEPIDSWEWHCLFRMSDPQPAGVLFAEGGSAAHEPVMELQRWWVTHAAVWLLWFLSTEMWLLCFPLRSPCVRPWRYLRSFTQSRHSLYVAANSLLHTVGEGEVLVGEEVFLFFLKRSNFHLL